MTSTGYEACVFIIRIWQEPREIEGAPPLWRGVIEHVQSGEKRYFEVMDDAIDFMETYTGQMGSKPGRLRRFKRWLKHF